MSNLWQLKNLETNEGLNDPQKLPENWGPVFGLHGFEEKLGDLSWLGTNYENQGWFVVGEESSLSAKPTEAELAWETAKKLLLESDWSMLPDVPMSNGVKTQWIEYRRELRNIRLQSGFPSDTKWPVKPD